MSDPIDSTTLEKDLRIALKWCAAEHNYLIELRDELLNISKQSGLGEKEGKLRKASCILRYISKSERRTHRFEQKVEGDLEEVYQELLRKTSFDFQAIVQIRDEIIKILTEFKIEERELVKYTSMYEGFLRHELSEAETKIQVLEEISAEYPYKAQQINKSLHQLLVNIEKEVRDIDQWVSALVVSLEKAQELLGELRGGLITVPMMLERLTDDILGNKRVSEISESQMLKQQLEALIFKKEFTNPSLIKLQESLMENFDGIAIKELLSKKERIEKIRRVLAKIESKPRYREFHREVILLSKLLSILFGEEIPKLVENLDRQAKALAKDDLGSFIVLFQEQKGMLAQANSIIEELGFSIILDQVVRSGFKGEISNGLKEQIAELVKELKERKPNTFPLFLSLYATCFALLVVLSPFIIPAMVLHDKIRSHHRGNILPTDTPELKQYLKNFAKRQFEYTSETVGLARKIYREYSVSVQGAYSAKHLQALQKALKKFKPFEVKRFLYSVAFIEGTAEDYNTYFGGLYIPSFHSIRCFIGYDTWEITLEHEIAHARSYGLPKSWYAAWDAVNKTGLDYSSAQQVAVKGEEGYFFFWNTKALYSKENSRGPALGYVKPYGATNIEEDIATFTEFVIGGDALLSPPVPIDALLILAFEDIYIGKARLLLKFGFIQRKNLGLFLASVKNLREKYQLRVYFSMHSLKLGGILKGVPRRFENLISAQNNFPALQREWLRVNKEGVDYSDLQRKQELKWPDISRIPREGEMVIYSMRYGFVSPNATKGWIQDVRSFIEWITGDPFPHIPFILGDYASRLIVPYLKVYRKKGNILRKYGLIEDWQHSLFEDLLRQFEHYNEI